MTPEELQAKLRDGIQAIRAGERARGRSLLLDVVRADERIEPAWLWLSTVLDDPADQIMALENALAVNPGNAHAQRRLEALRGGPAEAAGQPEGAEGPPRPAGDAAPSAATAEADQETPAPPAGPTASAVDPDDDPLQCPFCGQLTAETETRCPHCRRSLLAPGRWQAGFYLYALLLVLGLNVQAAVVEAFLPLLIPALPPSAVVTEWLRSVQLDSLVAAPLWALAVRAILLAVALYLLLGEVAWAYPFAAATFVADVLGNAGLWLTGQLPAPVAQVNLGLSGVAGLITLAALASRAFARQRLFTQLDRGLFSGLDYHRRGREHLRRGRLALAAVHFQKAVSLQPRTAQYYKDLGVVQARLGRLERAHRTLEAGAYHAPADPEFAPLLAAIDRRRAR